MLYYWYNSHRIDYHKFKYDKLKSMDLVERIGTRLYGICFGDEEYLDSGFKIAKGIVIKLINDESMDIPWDIGIDLDSRIIVLKKNPALTKNLNWWSFYSHNIELRNILALQLDELLES